MPKKFLPVNPSLYIGDIGKHFGAFRCLLKNLQVFTFSFFRYTVSGSYSFGILRGRHWNPYSSVVSRRRADISRRRLVCWWKDLQMHISTSRGYIDYGTFFVQLTRLVKTIVFYTTCLYIFSSNFVHSFQQFIANLVVIYYKFDTNLLHI